MSISLQIRSKKLVSSTFKALKTGGVLYITVPHVNKPVEYKHYRHFTKDILEREFGAVFGIEACYFIDRKSIFNHIIDMLLGNDLFVLNNRRIAG